MNESIYATVFICVKDTVLSLINYKLRIPMREAGTAHSVNSDTGETARFYSTGQ